MPKKHLKRLNAPKTWPILRKTGIFITRNYPGRNKRDLCMPISIFFKNMIKITHTTKETKKMLHQEEVLIDGKPVKDVKNPVEFMDVIRLPKLKAAYRLSLDDHGRLKSINIKDNEQNLKICKIVGKTKIKGGKTQLNLKDARNIIIDKDEYKIGDGVLIEIPSQKIKEHLKLEKGASVILTGGKRAGQKGNIVEIVGNRVRYASEKETALTLKKYAFVIGKEKPVVEI